MTVLANIVHTCNIFCVQEAVLSDIPVMMTMKEERPSGKLFAAYKNGTIEVVDEISAEAQRFLTVDSRVSGYVVGIGVVRSIQRPPMLMLEWETFGIFAVHS